MPLRSIALAAATLLVTGAAASAPESVSWAQIQAQPQPPGGERIPYGDEASQFGDLYLPEGEGPFPVAVLIHGGCWRVEYGLDHVAPLAADLAAQGVATWSLEYRRLGEAGGGWPGTFDDLVAGYQRLETLAGSYPIDTARVVLTGHSAGGHLALWLAARDRLPGGGWHSEIDPGLRGVVALAAITDLGRYAEGEGPCNRSAAELLGGEATEREARLALASPSRLLPATVPVDLVHGRQDRIVSPAQSVVHAARVRAQGGSARRHIIEGAGHFDPVAAFAPAWHTARTLILSRLGLAGQAQ